MLEECNEADGAENNIKVTIPFEKLQMDENVPVDVPVKDENAPVDEYDDVRDECKILKFCIIPRGILEIGEYLGYKDKRSVRKRLNPLLEQGRIAMTIPEKPNSRLQKYITIR